MSKSDYKALSDNELILLAHNDETAFSELISRHLNTVRRLAHLCTSNLSDCDDLISEGLIALINAVGSYDESRGTSFSTYVYVCVHNRMLTAIKKSSRIKNCEENIEDADLCENRSPESIVLGREEVDEVMLWMDEHLSSTEKGVVELYMSGEKYSGIAKKLDISTKSVDNALLRVRRKLRNKL